jgi:Lar family restriction alleviation protein
MTDQKLLPCPFCGSKDVIGETLKQGKIWFSFVGCNNCRCAGPNCDDEKQAIIDWNKRL